MPLLHHAAQNKTSMLECGSLAGRGDHLHILICKYVYVYILITYSNIYIYVHKRTIWARQMDMKRSILRVGPES